MVTAGSIPAITVKPPWSWGIAMGAIDPERAKLIENRGIGYTRFKYRGPVLIHAGAAWSPRGATDLRMRNLWAGHDLIDIEVGAPPIPTPPRSRGRIVNSGPELGAPPWQRLDAMALIAHAELVDIHPGRGCCHPWGEDSYQAADGRHVAEVAHLVLEDVQLVSPPVGIGGQLGLWHPDGLTTNAALSRLTRGEP